MLAGQSFVLGDYNSSRKLQLSKTIQKLDGILSYSVTKKTSFLVTTKAEYERDTLRISTARKYNVFIVSDEYLTACEAAQDSFVSPIDYALEPVPCADAAVIRQAAENVLVLWNLLRPAVLRLSVADSDGEPPQGVDSPRTVDSSNLSVGDGNESPQPAASEADDADDEDDDMPSWKTVLARRQKAQAAARQLAADQVAHHHANRLEVMRSERAEAAALEATEKRERKLATVAEKGAFARERKQLRKEAIKRNLQQMTEERRSQRDLAEQKKKQEVEAKHQAWLAAKMVKLEELARKLVERELHKAEWEAKQKQFQAEKEARLANKKDQNLRKLFVGGVNVDDIKHSCTALTGTLDQEKFDKLCTQRGEQLVNVFRQFGAIDEVKPFWQQRHAFVQFINAADAQKAMDELSQYENRKKYAEQTKAKIKAAGMPASAAHKPNYYVRWNYNKGGGKKKVFAKIAAAKAKAEGKDVEEEEPEDDGDPTAWEKTDSKGKSKPAPKPKKKKKKSVEKTPEQAAAEWAPVSTGESWADLVEQDEKKQTDQGGDVKSPKEKKEPKSPKPKKEKKTAAKKTPAANTEASGASLRQIEAIEPVEPIAASPLVPVPRLELTEDSFVATSTCVLMPPRDLWDPFVEIKKNHMNPRIKRPPYPHITLLAPFVRQHLFKQTAEALTAAFAAVQPFELSFDSFRIFANGSSNTLYLEPQQRPANSLQNLYRALTSTIRSPKRSNFEPHIGVAYVRNERECIALQNKYQKDWKPLRFRVQEIYFLHRTSADDPWEVGAVVPLGGNASAAPHFELGETTAGDQ